MSNQNPYQSPQGGFSGPQFTNPGSQPQAAEQRAGVDQHIAQSHGSRASTVAENEQRDAERRRLNRKKRRGFLIAAASVVIVVAVIVALMIWLWSTEMFVT